MDACKIWNYVLIPRLPSPSPPNRRGVVTNCFWCGSHQHRRPSCSLSALYLLNQPVDFNQTCTDTLLGWRKEVLWFWWSWPDFQGHTSTFKFSIFYKKKNLSAPYLLNQMTDSGQNFMHVLVTWKYKKDLIKSNREKVETPFSNFISQWGLSIAMETRVLIQSAPKP